MPLTNEQTIAIQDMIAKLEELPDNFSYEEDYPWSPAQTAGRVIKSLKLLLENKELLYYNGRYGGVKILSDSHELNQKVLRNIKLGQQNLDAFFAARPEDASQKEAIKLK